MVLRKSLGAALLSACAMTTNAGSLYLPTHLSPEIEAHVERLFIAADMPVVKRPIAINSVISAVEKAESSHPQLASKVRSYLERYDRNIGRTHTSIALNLDSGEANTLPNQRGFSTDSSYLISASAFWVVNDYIAVNLGSITGERPGQDENFLDGSFLSLGWDKLQLDVGFRPHWLSPFQESAMLISTQATSMPSVTLSNSQPLDFLGITYEVFMAQMSESDLIESGAQANRRVTGNPKLFGTHIGFAPFDGFAISVNRLMQFGGGDRSESPGDLLDAFINARQNDNIGQEGRDFGNQLTSVNTRYTFTGSTPFSVYMEYGGEDTSRTSSVHLGNTSLSFGIHFPFLLDDRLDISYETTSWQNGWYVNSNYGDGLTHEGTIIAHWAATQRDLRPAPPGQSHWLQVLWNIRDGNMLNATYRQVDNDNLASTNYVTAQELSLEYSRALGEYIAGVTVTAGTSAWNEDYSQISGFIRW